MLVVNIGLTLLINYAIYGFVNITKVETLFTNMAAIEWFPLLWAFDFHKTLWQMFFVSKIINQVINEILPNPTLQSSFGFIVFWITVRLVQVIQNTIAAIIRPPLANLYLILVYSQSNWFEVAITLMVIVYFNK